MLGRNPGATAILVDLPNSDKSNHPLAGHCSPTKLGLFRNSRSRARSVAMPSLLRLALFLGPLSKPHAGAAAVLVDELNPQFVIS
jgi:hypothetical protein